MYTLTFRRTCGLACPFLGPVTVKLAGHEPVILAVAGLFGVGAVFCATLPSHPPAAREPHGARTAVSEAGQAVGGTFAQLRDGIAYIRANHSIGWTLVYLGIAASLIGVIGVL